MIVKRLMKTDVSTASPTTSFKDCWYLIYKKKVHALPIVDKQKHLLGIISEENLLKLLFSSYSDFFNNGSFNPDAFGEKLKDFVNYQAKDLMKKKVFTIKADDHLVKTLSTMIIRNVTQLPVVDNNHKLIGIISRGDIFDYLWKMNLT